MAFKGPKRVLIDTNRTAGQCPKQPLRMKMGETAMGHQESFVAVSFPTCLQIIAALQERPAIEQILTHLGRHAQPRPKGRSARRPEPIARVARLRPSSARHERPPHGATARPLRTRSLGHGQTSLQEYPQGARPLNRIVNARIHRGYFLLDLQQSVHADLGRSG
jgi:hypothetical protein